MAAETDNLAIYGSCGSPAGYRRHLRNGTDACAGCKRAIADYMQEWRHGRGISKGRVIPDAVIKQYGIKVRA